ncbi:hypothetical protein EJ08DRAFT_59753 [Tothia fuscella]|uniref:Uncharacterized protein n=1 Tax=Tothia fuscella TaxID=1048955 RepID=A0A9P4NYN9_9PEZI|nr:hypothetical protein EJ08DRAFT_59753 [Tothia fuscella]
MASCIILVCQPNSLTHSLPYLVTAYLIHSFPYQLFLHYQHYLLHHQSRVSMPQECLSNLTDEDRNMVNELRMKGSDLGIWPLRGDAKRCSKKYHRPGKSGTSRRCGLDRACKAYLLEQTQYTPSSTGHQEGYNTDQKPHAFGVESRAEELQSSVLMTLAITARPDYSETFGSWTLTIQVQTIDNYSQIATRNTTQHDSQSL